jgi:hypothetical protein
LLSPKNLGLHVGNFFTKHYNSELHIGHLLIYTRVEVAADADELEAPALVEGAEDEACIIKDE